MMSSPLPGLNWTVSTGQTGLDTSAETAGKEKAAPPTSSAAAAALLDETMPFIGFSLKNALSAGKLGYAPASLEECLRAASGRIDSMPRRAESSANQIAIARTAWRTLSQRTKPGVS